MLFHITGKYPINLHQTRFGRCPNSCINKKKKNS